MASQPLQVVGDPADQACERDEVLGALRRLSERDQEILTLVAWDGLSNAEVAEVLGCGHKSVALRLHRARQRFKRALDAPNATIVDINPSRRATTHHYLAGEET